MFAKRLCPILLVFLTIWSCTKSTEGPQLDPDTQTLVEILLDEMDPLDADPLSWEDEELRWLDPLAGKSVVGLGEATHGTAEFFDAKHRIFRYMVEHHGFRVFAFEADFGESIYINEAIQQGNASAIESLMNAKMHFWTWKTKEVQELLEWMCTYNQGKADEDKVHYVGVDCQFNTFHIDMARDYLKLAGAPFLEFADSVLSEVEEADGQNYSSFDEQSFGDYLQRLYALKDSVTSYSEFLIAATSHKDFMLNERIVEVIRQVSEVRYYSGSPTALINYRDKYMAENTLWIREYHENAKIAVWAHNFHISDYESGSIGTMGNYLKYALWDQYATIGFLFSEGEFTAVGMEGDQYTELGTQSLDSIPKAGSLNALMSYTNQPAFSIEMRALTNYLVWYNAIEAGMDYFFIGSAYNNSPGDYYIRFDPFLYHYLIYFHKTRASNLL
jgi:erythromycin esterase